MDTQAALPIPYYLCWLTVILLVRNAWENRTDGWGIPAIALYSTICAWYLMDPIYNGYQGYVSTFGAGICSLAWWEVLLFLVSLAVLIPVLNKKINSRFPANASQLFLAMRSERINADEFQDQVDNIFKPVLVGWCILMTIGLYRIDFDFASLFFPYIVGDLTSPWNRGRLGGTFDSILALANYLQVMLTALIGIVLVLSKRGKVFLLSGIVYFLAEPFYLFARTRNTMLATLLPGLMALVTLRMRSSIFAKLAVIGIAFAALNFWFLFVLEIRSQSGSVSDAFKSGAFNKTSITGAEHKKKHEGFNMFEELGYINYFTDNGTYKPNWGTRYFAEIVNPIPRVIWPGKPLIGIDYAVARGLAYGDLSSSTGGVAASVSTGMIGQGVVNFGRILGPIAAAFLMAIWVAVLARQDLMGEKLGHLLLYAIGLVLTFNMGRDITLLVIYPFVFGWILLNWLIKDKKAISQTKLPGASQPLS